MERELAMEVRKALSEVDRSYIENGNIPIKSIAANIVANGWTDTFADFMGLDMDDWEEEFEWIVGSKIYESTHTVDTCGPVANCGKGFDLF